MKTLPKEETRLERWEMTYLLQNFGLGQKIQILMER